MPKSTRKSEREKRRESLMKRQRKAADKAGGGKGFFKRDLEGVKFWTPDENEHILDVIPYEAGTQDPDEAEGTYTYGLYVYTHNDVGGQEGGGQSFICPDRTYGKPCPICEHRKQLERQSGDEDLIKSLRTSRYPRSIYNVIVYDGNEGTTGVQVFHCSFYLFENTLNKLTADPRNRGNAGQNVVLFADPDEGKTIAFTREGKGMNTRYIGHRFLDRDYVISDAILDQAHKLDELLHLASYAEIYEAYWGEPYEDEDQTESPSSSRTSRRTPDPEPDDDPIDDEPGDDPAPDPEPEDEGGESIDDELKSIREDLEDMSLKDLKEYCDDEDYDVKLPKTKNAPNYKKKVAKAIDDIMEEVEDRIRKENEGGEPAVDDSTEETSTDCPGNGEFGEDFNELSDCDDCDNWDACAEENSRLNAAKRAKKDDKKSSGNKRSSRRNK